MLVDMFIHFPIAQAQPGAAPSPMMQFLPLIVIFAIFYFILIRPQQKRQKELNQLVKNLKKGDQVVTAGGILGIVTGLQDEYVVIKTGGSDNTKMEVLKSSITGLRNQEQKNG